MSVPATTKLQVNIDTMNGYLAVLRTTMTMPVKEGMAMVEAIIDFSTVLSGANMSK